MRKSMLISLIAIFVGFGSIISNVSAYTWGPIEAHVTGIEASYMPGWVDIIIDVAAGPFNAGSELTFTSTNPDAVKSIYSLALTALTSCHRIRLYGENNGAIDNIYILNTF